MPRISSEKAVKTIGNRYDLILIASTRVRELNNGFKPKVQTENGNCLTALKEIEDGHITRDYLKRLKK